MPYPICTINLSNERMRSISRRHVLQQAFELCCQDLTIFQQINLPAIAMEEAIPVAVSEAAALAPEEIYNKKAKAVKGETEVTSEDRKKDRKERKEKHKKEKAEKESAQRREEKLNPKKRKKMPTVAEAMDHIKKSKNVTIVEDKDKGKKKFSTVQAFQQLQAQASGAAMAAASFKPPSNAGKASHLKL